MNRVFSFFQKHYFAIGLCAALFIAFLLRASYLSTIPNIIHIDEAALGYNAWCLAHFGVDRYLNEMPVYPQNYIYGGQSPLYTYLVALFIRTIGNGGLSLLLVRLPGLIFSMLVVIFTIKTIHLVFGSRKLTLACAFLVSVLPYFIMHGRLGFDCNLMFGCCVIALYTIAKYVSTQKTADLCICGAACGLILYSYAPSYILVPLFLSLTALYLLFVKKINIPRTVLWAVCVCVSSLPILLFILSLLFKLEPFEFLGLHIYPFASGRVNEISLEDFWTKVWHAIQITLTHGGLVIDSVPKYCTMYRISVSFIILGFLMTLYHFCVSLRTRRFHYSALFLLFFISCTVTIGLVDAPQIYRANYFFAGYAYFLFLGIRSVCHFLKFYRRPFVTVLAGTYFLCALAFVRYYFTMYEIVLYPNSAYFIPAVDAVSFAESELCAETVYIDSMEFQEVQLFFSPISPYEWASLRYEGGYGHYNFRVDGDTDISTSNAYLARKENAEFIKNINAFAIPHETIEYENYYLFYFTEQP